MGLASRELSGTITPRQPAGVDDAYFVVEGGDVLALDPELASSFGARIVRGGILDLDAGVVIDLAVVNGFQEAREAGSFADDDVDAEPVFQRRVLAWLARHEGRMGMFHLPVVHEFGE